MAKRELNDRINACKLVMHVRCFDEIQQNMIHDPGSRHNGGSDQLRMLKSCCHNSLKELCVHTHGEWRKRKKYSHHKDIENYPDGCIICLKTLFVGCVSLVTKIRQILRIEGHENNKKK